MSIAIFQWRRTGSRGPFSSTLGCVQVRPPVREDDGGGDDDTLDPPPAPPPAAAAAAVFAQQVIQAGLGDTALFSVTSSCHNCQLSTQRVMGARGKAVSRQARPRGHAHPLPKGRKEKS